MKLLPLILLFLSLSSVGRLDAAQGVNNLVEGRVLVTTGDLAEIDRGLLDGLRQGDSVTIFVPSGNALVGNITSVSQRSATVDVPGSSGKIDIGLRVEIRIPAGRTTDVRPNSGAGTPEHPP